jgi:hypothetical protein
VRHEGKCIGRERESCVPSGSLTPLSARTSAPNGVCMYRIELSPGEETVFRSIEELAVAIKRGVITSRAHIWHNASSRWLPIQFHPHYKVAISMELSQAALVAGPPVKQLSSLMLRRPADTEPPASAFVPSAEPEARPARATKKKSGAAKPKRSRRQGQPRRQLRIALVGALLIGGAQWVLSAPFFSRSEVPAIIKAQQHLIAAPTEAVNRVSSPNSAAMVPVLPRSQAPSAPVNLEELTEPTQGRPTAPSFGGTGATVESGSAPIEPAPDSIDLSVPRIPSADSLRSRKVDSTSRKATRPTRR